MASAVSTLQRPHRRGDGLSSVVERAMIEASDPYAPPSEDQILALILGELTLTAPSRPHTPERRGP